MVVVSRNIFVVIIYVTLSICSASACDYNRVLRDTSFYVAVDSSFNNSVNLYQDDANTSFYSITDSIARLQDNKNIFIPNSKKAVLWGLLPGGGQIYNRKYWKLPIVWGAFTTCVYAIRFNQQRYREYHDAYRDMSSSDPSQHTAWLAFTPRGTKPSDYNKYKYLLNNFKRGDEFFHRWRDISIVSVIGVYALSMIDAYVDAELSTFDISPDLSVRIYPKLEQPLSSNLVCNMALGCTLNF